MKWVDLTHALDSGTPPYPGDPRPELHRIRELGRDGFNDWSLCTGLHAGTHVDLPLHMLDDPRTAAGFAPERFCGRGVLLDHGRIAAAGEAAAVFAPETLNTVYRMDVADWMRTMLSQWEK